MVKWPAKPTSPAKSLARPSRKVKEVQGKAAGVTSNCGRRQWQIILDRRQGRKLGVDIDENTMIVHHIVGHGIVADWNKDNAHLKVHCGDKVIRVNQQTDLEAMVAECQKPKVLKILLEREDKIAESKATAADAARKVKEEAPTAPEMLTQATQEIEEICATWMHDPKMAPALRFMLGDIHYKTSVPELPHDKEESIDKSRRLTSSEEIHVGPRGSEADSRGSKEDSSIERVKQCALEKRLHGTVALAMKQCSVSESGGQSQQRVVSEYRWLSEQRDVSHCRGASQRATCDLSHRTFQAALREISQGGEASQTTHRDASQSRHAHQADLDDSGNISIEDFEMYLDHPEMQVAAPKQSPLLDAQWIHTSGFFNPKLNNIYHRKPEAPVGGQSTYWTQDLDLFMFYCPNKHTVQICPAYHSESDMLAMWNSATDLSDWLELDGEEWKRVRVRMRVFKLLEKTLETLASVPRPLQQPRAHDD